ncbi:ABC transporter permease subunit [Microbispora sp. NPDC049125]|uniref:ABC transporter permease subunit n=1 Tax=Microbispora sp. NPDC049125 TaxID=3154929 RepID=UPI003465A974
MTPTMTRYRSAQPAGRDGFPQLLRTEWTKFRTVRGWVLGMVAAAVMMVLVALLAGAGSDQHGLPAVPIGPGGEPVTDSFYFVHRPLGGNGSITVSVAALRGGISSDRAGLRPGIVPWAKAGIIIKESTRQGSPYAAIMVTGSHGVRMQDDYVNDRAGLPGAVSAASPRWLRLDRSGDAVTGYESADGTHWTMVGTVHVDGLGSTVQGGLFVASPPSVQGFGTVPSVATAVFGNLRVQGGWLGGHWKGGQVGPESRTFSGYPANAPGSFTDSGGSVTVTGAGDIAPAVRETLPTGGTIGDILTGTFAALIAVIVVGTQFVTAEYRDDMIYVTLAASPRRSRVLAAKAIVLGAVTFVAGLAGSVVAIPLGKRLAEANGVYLFPVTSSALLRAEVGTAALLATAAILALAVGAMLRRSAGAVTTVVVAIALPYILVAQIPFLPAGASSWLTRVTPAAAFAVQQTLVPYHQVTSISTPYNGYYPLAPWAGFAVLAGYAAVCLAVAAVLLRRRDA